MAAEKDNRAVSTIVRRQFPRSALDIVPFKLYGDGAETKGCACACKLAAPAFAQAGIVSSSCASCLPLPRGAQLWTAELRSLSCRMLFKGRSLCAI